MEIIKTQKEHGNKRNPVQINSMMEEIKIFEKQSSSLSHLAKIGILNKNSDLYRTKCIDSTFYPFSIALSGSSGSTRDNESRCSTPSLGLSSITSHQSKSNNGSSRTNDGYGRVELIATSYSILKEWVLGINLLISNK
jgi:hypothetical protein